jgi:apolipoprotein N-acyltransferase
MNPRLRPLLQLGAGLVLAGVSGLLLTLAFPPYGLWPLIGVGFIPAIVAQHRVLPRPLSGLAYGVGLGTFFWGYFGPMFAGLAWFLDWLPLFVMAIATLLTLGNRAFHERTGYRWFVLEGAVGWVGFEALRGFLPVIGTGGFVAYAFYQQPWLIQPVGVFSIYGLSLLIMLANYALALGVLALLDQRRQSVAPPGRVTFRQAGRWLAGTGAVATAWIAASLLLLGAASGPAQIRVAALAPGPVGAGPRLFAQTRQAAAQGAQLVVWPEGSFMIDPRRQDTAAFQALAAETGVYLVIGYGVPTDQGLRNEATLLAPDGQFLGVYGKDHPVVWLGERSLTGGSYPAYHTALGTIGTIICYDLNFTDTARKTAANGAQLIAVPSNDWPGLASKQYTSLVFRAVENRVALVKADSGLDSAIIAPTGQIIALAITDPPAATTLLTSVALGRGDAPLIHLGDWVGWLCIAGIAGFIALDRLSGRRARRAGPARPQEAPVPPVALSPK